MLEWAAHPDRKLILANPAKGVKLLKGGKRERFLSEAELARLADTLAAMEAEHGLSPTATAAIRLLLLSGCRKSEILSLRWEWVDAERGVLRLPDSKTGAKVVPLAATAVKLLAELPRRGDYVLPAATGPGHYTGLQKDWERVRARAGLAAVRVHDLRHSFASFAVADGNSLYLIGKVLGHRQARTTEIYAHLADDPIRAVADRTAARIAAAMERGSGRDPAPVNVVSPRGGTSLRSCGRAWRPSKREFAVNAVRTSEMIENTALFSAGASGWVPSSPDGHGPRRRFVPRIPIAIRLALAFCDEMCDGVAEHIVDRTEVGESSLLGALYRAEGATAYPSPPAC